MRSEVNSLKISAVTLEETSSSKRSCASDDSCSDDKSVGNFFTDSGVTDGNDEDEFGMMDFEDG
jgi:hypothetical protein